MLYILNSPILTTYGHYTFNGPMTVAEAKALLHEEFTSAIGHAGTAELLSVLLDISIPINRVRIEMQPGDKALVFRLLERVEEGKVFSREEVESLPFELGVLEREKSERMSSLIFNRKVRELLGNDFSQIAVDTSSSGGAGWVEIEGEGEGEDLILRSGWVSDIPSAGIKVETDYGEVARLAREDLGIEEYSEEFSEEQLRIEKEIMEDIVNEALENGELYKRYLFLVSGI